MQTSAGGKCGCIAAAIAGLILPSVVTVLVGGFAGCSFEIPCNSFAPLVGFVVGIVLTVAIGLGVRWIVDRI